MPVCFIATAPTPISAKRQSTACSRFRTRLEPIERAGFIAAYSGKKLSRGILRGASGAFGNAATRLAAFVVSGGSYVYGSYPDIDELYSQQADELDQTKRATILAKMQQLVYEKAIYVPLRQFAFINGVGPRVGQSGFGLIPGFAYTAPFEDITIKAHNDAWSDRMATCNTGIVIDGATGRLGCNTASSAH